MQKILKSNRFFILAISFFFFSLLIWGGMSDLKFYSRDFMKDSEIKFSLQLENEGLFPGPVRTREIASSEMQNLKTLGKDKMAFVALDKKKIDGRWEVYHWTRTDGTAGEMDLPVDLELVKNPDGSGAVKITLERGSQHLLPPKMDVVFFREFNPQKITIFLMEEKNGSLKDFSVFEAKKSPPPEIKHQESVSKISDSAASATDKGSAGAQDEAEFILWEVVYKDGKDPVISGEKVSGTIKMGAGGIEYLTAKFETKKGEEVAIDIQNSELNNNYFQYFVDEGRQSVSGVINRFREEEFIVTLINGPHSGTKLKFVTDRMVDEINRSLAETGDSARNDPKDDRDERDDRNDDQEPEAVEGEFSVGASEEKKEDKKSPVMMASEVRNPASAEADVSVIREELQNEILLKRYEHAEVVRDQADGFAF